LELLKFIFFLSKNFRFYQVKKAIFSLKPRNKDK